MYVYKIYSPLRIFSLLFCRKVYVCNCIFAVLILVYLVDTNHNNDSLLIVLDLFGIFLNMTEIFLCHALEPHSDRTKSYRAISKQKSQQNTTVGP